MSRNTIGGGIDQRKRYGDEWEVWKGRITWRRQKTRGTRGWILSLFIDASYFGQAAGGILLTLGFAIQIFTLDFAEAGVISSMGLPLGSLIK